MRSLFREMAAAQSSSNGPFSHSLYTPAKSNIALLNAALRHQSAVWKSSFPHCLRSCLPKIARAHCPKRFSVLEGWCSENMLITWESKWVYRSDFVRTYDGIKSIKEAGGEQSWLGAWNGVLSLLSSYLMFGVRFALVFVFKRFSLPQLTQCAVPFLHAQTQRRKAEGQTTVWVKKKDTWSTIDFFIIIIQIYLAVQSFLTLIKWFFLSVDLNKCSSKHWQLKAIGE